MSNNNICRVCLCKGVKMYEYSDYYLKSYYEEIIAKKIDFQDNLPRHFCYQCAALIYKYHKFKEKCLVGESILRELVLAGPITPNSISQSERRNKNLISSLAITTNNKVKSINIKSYTFKKSKKLHKKKTEIKIYPESDSEDQLLLNELKCTLDKKSNEINKLNNEIDIENEIKNEIIDNESINEEKEVIKPDTAINFDCHLTEDGLILTDVIATPIARNDITFSDNDNYNDEDNLYNDNNLDIKDIDNTIDKKEKSIKVKRPVNKNKTQKKNNNKSLKKEGTNPTQRRQRRFETYSSKQNVLDSEHWLKIHLSEEEALVEHKAKANDPKYLVAAFKCTECFKGFSKEEMLVRHRKLRHDETVGNIICRFCNRRFKIKCQLSRHISQHYSKFKCLRCDLVCVLENTAQFHNEYHNGVTRKCKHCGEEFRHLSTYYTHLRSHRSEHVCALCGASFVSALGLNMHKRNMHVATVTDSTEEVNIHCERCDIMFESKKAYDEHLIHSAMHAEGVEDLINETPMPSLPKHRRKTLRRNPRILSQCGICSKTFSTQAAYFKHHSTEHEGVPHPARPNDRVVCEICGQCLAIGSMPNHINTHTREKKFTCATCGMQFISKGSLKRHQLTHTGEKPFECTLCDKRFTQKCSMQLHYRTFHLKEPYPKRNRRKKNDNNVQENTIIDERNDNITEASLKIVDRWRLYPVN